MKDVGIQVIDDSANEDVLSLKIIPIRDEKGLIEKGLVIGETLQQNKAFLLIGKPGDFRANPTLGVGFEDVLLSDNYLEYRHKIRENFMKDGMKITELNVYHNKPIKIDSKYE